jgi:hypothetical protein
MLVHSGNANLRRAFADNYPVRPARLHQRSGYRLAIPGVPKFGYPTVAVHALIQIAPYLPDLHFYSFFRRVHCPILLRPTVTVPTSTNIVPGYLHRLSRSIFALCCGVQSVQNVNPSPAL